MKRRTALLCTILLTACGDDRDDPDGSGSGGSGSGSSDDGGGETGGGPGSSEGGTDGGGSGSSGGGTDDGDDGSSDGSDADPCDWRECGEVDGVSCGTCPTPNPVCNENQLCEPVVPPGTPCDGSVCGVGVCYGGAEWEKTCYNDCWVAGGGRCGDGETCIQGAINSDETGLCMQECTADGDCVVEGWVCGEITPGGYPTSRVCRPPLP